MAAIIAAAMEGEAAKAGQDHAEGATGHDHTTLVEGGEGDEEGDQNEEGQNIKQSRLINWRQIRGC